MNSDPSQSRHSAGSGTPVSLRPLNALGILLLLLGFVLFNNSTMAWQLSQQAYSSSSQSSSSGPEQSPQQGNLEGDLTLQQPEDAQLLQKYKVILLLRQALYIIASMFLMFLGLQILRKRHWACHFFSSIHQLARLALLLIPISTLLALLNRPLIDSLIQIYQPIVQGMVQQQQIQPENGQDVVFNAELIRTAIQVGFGIVALLGIAIASLILRLSRRCLHPEVQELLHNTAAPPSRLSHFILCLPAELLLVLLLSVYGTVMQLLEIMTTLLGTDTAQASELALLLSLAAFSCFSLSLLQLTNRNMQKNHTLEQIRYKYQLLKQALNLCAAAYAIQLLQTALLPLWQQNTDESQNFAAIESVINNIDSLSNIGVLLWLFGLYYLLRRTERHQVAATQAQISREEQTVLDSSSSPEDLSKESFHPQEETGNSEIIDEIVDNGAGTPKSSSSEQDKPENIGQDTQRR